MDNQTPITLNDGREKATALLDVFSKFTEYRHGTRNPYRDWLDTDTSLAPELVVRFLCFWYPVSRRQPQILLRCAAAFPDHADRKLIMQNYLEEDGLIEAGHNPHYDLLEKLINKIGGDLAPDIVAEGLIGKLYNALNEVSHAQASGFLAGIEHPALDISAYFNKVIGLCGFSNLLTSDPYLTIHIDVEPDHIVWSHGSALRYMKGDKEEEVLHAFQNVMSFWKEFWAAAFSKLNYSC